MKTFPDFVYEHNLTKNSDGLVIGVDEVGRGCLAGPLVTAAVCFDPINNYKSDIQMRTVINDSKLLSRNDRKLAFDWLSRNTKYAYGVASVEEIDSLGLTAATISAFNRAIVSLVKILNTRVNHILIDGQEYLTKGISYNCHKHTIVKGDSKILTIAAASIVAKTIRDDYMFGLGKQKKFYKYHWYKNVGYGTKQHIDAIKQHGVTKHHRRKFVQTLMGKF